MGIPILAGRDFVKQDGIGEVGITKVIIINKALASFYWRDQDPIGQRLVTNNLTMEVIGLVDDARYNSLETAPVPEVYYPNGVFPQEEISVVIRTSMNPAGLSPAIRNAIQDVEPDAFISPFRTMDEVVANSVSDRRFMMVLLSVFAASGLVLAVVGIAGLVAYSLSLRIREVGIRVAMGAGPRDVVWLISRQGLAPAFTGLALGLLIALGFVRVLSQMLYTVSPYDSFVFVSSIAALGVVTVLAAAFSAFRACRLDAGEILK
jgi:ABC-type antimicrobial peptide transport system permease subunit